MTTVQDIRRILASGQATVGSWLQLTSTDAAEIMGRAGYDWIAVDMEHGAFGRTGLTDIFRAIERGGAAPFARLAEATKTPIKAALEAGAQGLIFPMIESRAQLDRAVNWALYPDAGGERGVGYCRANAFGRDFTPYCARARDIFLVAQIENIRALHHLDDILRHPRLDAVMVGPYDLSCSMGITARFDHPDFLAAIARIEQGCARHGVHMGLHIVEPNPALLSLRIAQGYRFIAYGIDASFLWSSAERPRL